MKKITSKDLELSITEVGKCNDFREESKVGFETDNEYCNTENRLCASEKPLASNCCLTISPNCDTHVQCLDSDKCNDNTKYCVTNGCDTNACQSNACTTSLGELCCDETVKCTGNTQGECPSIDVCFETSPVICSETEPELCEETGEGCIEETTEDCEDVDEVN